MVTSREGPFSNSCSECQLHSQPRPEAKEHTGCDLSSPITLGGPGFTLSTVAKAADVPLAIFLQRTPESNSCCRLQPFLPGTSGDEGISFLPPHPPPTQSPPTEPSLLQQRAQDRSDIHKSTYYSFSSTAFDSCYMSTLLETVKQWYAVPFTTYVDFYLMWFHN